MIAPQDLTICKKSDGSDFLLGQGTFGAVRPLLSYALTFALAVLVYRIQKY